MLASKEQPTSNRVQTEGGNSQRTGRHDVMREYIAVMMREESIVDDISIEALRDSCVLEVKRLGIDLVANVENAGGLQFAQFGEPFLEPCKPIWLSDRGVLAVLVSNVLGIRELERLPSSNPVCRHVLFAPVVSQTSAEARVQAW